MNQVLPILKESNMTDTVESLRSTLNLPPGIVSNFIDLDGIKTHFVEAGVGDPVVLVHGAGPGASGWSGWREAIPALAQHFHVYAIDTLGFGLTDKPTNIVYRDQASVQHLAAFIDALCLDDVNLIGNSRGAYIAAKYLLDYPGRVRSAVLVSSGSIASAMGIERTAKQSGGRGILDAYDGTPEAMKRWMEVIVHDHSKITDELIQRRVAMAALPGHDYCRKSQNDYRKSLKNDPNERQLFDIRHRLPEVTLPIHMVWGAKDSFAPAEFAERLKPMLPNMTFEMFEESGHQAQNDESDRFNETAINFIRRAKLPQANG
jgi:2-hydroxy-6-oxonona-2,4-dienedioate hydrolase